MMAGMAMDQSTPPLVPLHQLINQTLLLISPLLPRISPVLNLATVIYDASSRTQMPNIFPWYLLKESKRKRADR